MTKKEAKIIAEVFGTPCDYSPMDEYMFEHSSSWCEKHCGHIDNSQCWKRYLKLKIQETDNDI